jgi:hypothetical protein
LVVIAIGLDLWRVLLQWSVFGGVPWTADFTEPIGGHFRALRRATPATLSHLAILAPLTGVISLMLPIWLCARAWGREGDPSLRVQLGVTPLTARQVLAAKTLIWFLPCPILVGHHLARELAFDWAVFEWAPRDSYLWVHANLDEMTENSALYLTSPEMEWEQFRGFLIRRAAHGLLLSTLALLSVLSLLGVVTRLTLRWFRPGLSFAATMSLGAAIAALHVAASLIVWARLFGPNPDLALQAFRVWMPAALTALMAVFALVLWRSLPRRVARALGASDRSFS